MQLLSKKTPEEELPSIGTKPDWPTQMKSFSPDGIGVGIDNEVWLWRRVKLGPVSEAKTIQEGIEVGDQVSDAFRGLARITRTRAGRRRLSQTNYRDVQLLLINIPSPFEPNPGPVGVWLREQFTDASVDRRILLFGVKLRGSMVSGGVHAAVDSLTDLMTGTDYVVNMAEYKKDVQRVGDALSRAGLQVPTPEEARICNSWWNGGKHPDTPILVHPDHLHFFGSPATMKLAERLESELVPCDEEQWDRLPKHHTLSMVSFSGFTFDTREIGREDSHWVTELLQAGACAVSIRGKVEPATISRNQMRTNRRTFMTDQMERNKDASAMSRAEQEEKLDALRQFESAYATGSNPPPTLIQCSVIAALSGANDDGSYEVANTTDVSTLHNMTDRQETAWAEMMMCSRVRANPDLRELPVDTIAHSGIANLDLVGDIDGALLGFTERDHQPAYISPTRASTSDGSPWCACVGNTGSGKSQGLLWTATQFDINGNPQIIIDPKHLSNHSAMVHNSRDGVVKTLDDLNRADGAFDPLRFTLDPKEGIDMACSLLMQADPWRNGGLFETDLANAISFGVGEGATCTGQALEIALRANKAKREMVMPPMELAKSSPLFRACLGTDPNAPRLSTSDGITLLMVGNTNLDLPGPGRPPTNLQQRCSVALVRAMVYGSGMALAHRDGVLHFDEGWVATQSGPEELERTGRLAREHGFLPILYTQRPTDVVRAGLTGFVSRGIILANEDPAEAAAALEMFKLEPTPERVRRIMAKRFKGASADEKEGVPNWDSLRALRDGETGEVLRGSVAYYVDLFDHVCPVEIKLPKTFFEMTTTNSADLKKRYDLARAAKSAEDAA